MLTLTFAIITFFWLLGGAGLIAYLYYKDYDTFNAMGFVGIVWGLLALTTCIIGGAENDYRRYHSGVGYDIASSVV